MQDTWSSRIRRAEELAAENEAAALVLRFYAALLGAQARIHEALGARPLSGSIERDLAPIREAAPALLRVVATHGADPLAHAARQLLQDGEPSLDDILLTYWREPSDAQFFGKAILQPYARALVESGRAPLRPNLTRTASRCPHCGGKPQLAVLVSDSVETDGGGRRLLCAMCLSTWPFGRVVCANCGERDEAKLGYFGSAAYDHVRVEACDTCRRYLKGIDLSRLGIAVPIVDEVAAAPLDLWARDRGYTKIEMNQVGL